MNTYSRLIKSIIATGLLLASSYAFALPSLKFGGTISYTTDVLSPADLNIYGVLLPDDYSEFSYIPDLATSSVILSADFITSTSDGSYTTGSFSTTPANDLLISDSFGLNTLLTGNITSLTLTGREGTNLGVLSGEILITGGDLAADFGGVGSLFAISFNLDTVFSTAMFESNFFGVANGSLTGVPEPMPLALLGFGLFGVTLARRFHNRKS